MNRQELEYFAKQLKKVRDAGKFTQTAVAAGVKVAMLTVSRWERAQSEPGYTNLKNLSKFFHLPVEYFLLENADGIKIEYKEVSDTNVLGDQSSLIHRSSHVDIPLLAEIPTGLPDFVESDIEDNLMLPRRKARGAKFAIHMPDGGMTPRIEQKDDCVIRPMDEVIDGKIMFVFIDGKPYIRRAKKVGNIVELHAENSCYPTIKSKNIKVVGQVIYIGSNAE